MMDAKLQQRSCMQTLMRNLKRKQLNIRICSQAHSAAARGYVDAIIEPADTRKYVIGAFEMLFTKERIVRLKKHGTV